MKRGQLVPRLSSIVGATVCLVLCGCADSAVEDVTSATTGAPVAASAPAASDAPTTSTTTADAPVLDGAGDSTREQAGATTGGPIASDSENTPAKQIVEPPCDDTAACAYSFEIDGHPYALDCTAVRADVVTDVVVASGMLTGQPAALHAIDGVDQRLLLALDRPGGGACYEGDPTEPSTPWVLAIGAGADLSDILPIICSIAVYSPARFADNCDDIGDDKP